jgi:predicted dehydrogenase
MSDAVRKVRWGVLGNAKIAREKVIPAMQRGKNCEVVAMASRNAASAAEVAAKLGVGKVYGTYEELLADPDVDAIYNPLPNDLHVPWSIRAAEAGKHVLCEKPIGLSSAECLELIAARDRCGVKVGEAFMAKTHRQWLRAREIVASGEIGELRVVLGAFSYYNVDAQNIRNTPTHGGGALMDIGCYPVTLSRMLFGGEPVRVSAGVERDPQFGTDRLTSAVLEFANGHCVFTCGTQMAPYQRMILMGTLGRIEIPIPFNAPPDRPLEVIVDSGKSLFGDSARVERLPVCDQYTIQGELFSAAILGNGDVPVGLEDSHGNMLAIESVFKAALWNSR